MCRQVIPPTGMRRCRPLMSSGTRAVSVGVVGISHHAWQINNCKKSSRFVCYKRYMQTREFVTRLFERHGHGLVEKLTAIRDHNVTSRAQRGLAGGSTGTADCGFLYLLVKAFGRRSIFEIGTYVGTSAVAMTMAGGYVTTCDPKDYGCLPPGIRFLNMTDRDALRLLRREGALVDMVFADAAVSSDAITFLNKIGSNDMIFTAHDYASGAKGEVCVDLMSKHYRRAEECTWFLPEAEPIEVAPGLLIEEATAAMVPNDLIAAL